MKPLLVLISLFSFLSACGGSGDKPLQPTEGSAVLEADFSNTKAFVATAPYASVLASCATISDSADSCTLTTLPVIGQENPNPSVEDIMNRVVVSHDWMGNRFRALLQQMPVDILLLLRSTTAIVIDDDIRPSYYWSATGAIYIDPANLWLTNAEKATINQKQDFRSNFGNDLQFKRYWRYIIGNQYAWQSFSLNGSEERQLSDTLINTSWLFYHELAHANDCMSISLMPQLNNNLSFLDNFFNIRDSGECVQDKLIASAELQSQTWLDLAQVLYHGANSNSTQRAMTPEQVGGEFSVDSAMDTYSYSSVWEDTATAFEAVMMLKSFNAIRDMAIVPYTEDFLCETSPVKYGIRGRIGDTAVMLRSKLVAEEILPEVDFSNFFANLAPSELFPFNHGWCVVDLSSQQQNVSAEVEAQIKQTVENHRDIL